MASFRTASTRASAFLRQTRSSPLHASTRARQFHASFRLAAVKPFLLADIGEGITECQLIQWFVQPGARVEQFDKICEVQSDKASVEITSPFDGVIKKLHYEPDDMAITGKPLVDIDIQGEISPEDEAKLAGGAEAGEAEGKKAEQQEEAPAVEAEDKGQDFERSPSQPQEQTIESPAPAKPPSRGDKGTLATPAIRHMTKEHNLDIADIRGSGKDGRVLKEDVLRHVEEQKQPPSQAQSQPPAAAAALSAKEDKKVPLTPVQMQMFKLMTKALNIPHFLYTCATDMTAITETRKRLNAKASSPEQKLTHLPFVIKALSLALQQHPLLNSSLDTKDPKKPELVYRGSHNFGVAIDAPSGLLVPVLKNVQDMSISEISVNLRQLSEKARNNKLAPGDFSGATFTVSNIGSVGGGVVAPVISEPQVAIVGIGRSKIVPAFNENEELVKKEEATLSWSADHRVVDGAECARCAEKVKAYLEDPGSMIVGMR